MFLFSNSPEILSLNWIVYWKLNNALFRSFCSHDVRNHTKLWSAISLRNWTCTFFFSSLSQPVVRKTSDKQNRKSADNGVIPYPEPKGNELLDNGPNQTHLSRPLKETGSTDSIYTSYQIISIYKMLMDRTR